MKNTKEIMVNIRVDKNLRDLFNTYCKENGFSVSKRLRVLMEKDSQGKLIIK
jgi:antitoxin component of RelBE/YafQ-DinJ toxin-antitoxin module